MNLRLLTLFSMGLMLEGCADDSSSASYTTSSTYSTTTSSTTSTTLSYEADYIGGQYRIDHFSLYPETDDGMDFNGDGAGDNALPGTLVLLDAFLDSDLSVDGFNTSINEAFANDEAIMLMENAYANNILDMAILTGELDKNGALGISETSFDQDGNLLSELDGGFYGAESFIVNADRIVLMFPFYPDEPPVPLPLEMVTLSGHISDGGMSGELFGVIPTDDLIEMAIEPIIPKEGSDGMTKKEILDLVGSILSYKTVSDIELSDGGRGISAAFSYSTTDSEW